MDVTQPTNDEQTKHWNATAGCAWVEAQQVVQPLQGIAITPLQVIHQEQGRPLGSEDGAGEGLEQPLALPGL